MCTKLENSDLFNVYKGDLLRISKFARMGENPQCSAFSVFQPICSFSFVDNLVH